MKRRNRYRVKYWLTKTTMHTIIVKAHSEDEAKEKVMKKLTKSSDRIGNDYDVYTCELVA